MEEESVTVDGETRSLPEPFLVMATQNPNEYEGTFPLPEAQLDRFLLKLSLGYPGEQQEIEMLTRHQRRDTVDSLQPVLSTDELISIQEQVANIHVDDSIKAYIVSLTKATRDHQHVYLGVSPRGSPALLHVSQALAYIRGREYVVPDDVKTLTPYTLSHRIILNSESRLSGASVPKVIRDVLNQVQVPTLPDPVHK
jgi:MoxR-like ATPase